MGGAALSSLESKIIGPLDPSQFGTGTGQVALEAVIDAGFDAVTNADTANVIAGTQVVNVLGNVYLIVIYKT